MIHKLGDCVRVESAPEFLIDDTYVGRVGVVIGDEDGLYDVEFADGTEAINFEADELIPIATAPDYDLAMLSESVKYLDRARKIIYCKHKSIGLIHSVLVCDDCGLSAADIVEPVSHRLIVTEWERRYREKKL